MRWSWKIGRLLGVDLYLHATFVLLLVWVGLNLWQMEGRLSAVVEGVGFILILFACVVLHELGHSLTARHYGIRTRNITLLPIGGVATLERMPDDPKEEMLVALAGPAVNAVIALGLWILLIITGNQEVSWSTDFTEGSLGERLMTINVVLAAFNMLPALPMDGGRVFRAALALRMDSDSATRLAARLGRLLALVFGVIGVLFNPFLVVIALFVWIGATAEEYSNEIRHAVAGVSIGQAMLTDFRTLSPSDSLSFAMDLALKSHQKDFPVVTGEVIEGVLFQPELLKGLRDGSEEALVADWMRTDQQEVSIREPLDSILQKLSKARSHILLVTDRDYLVGLINLEQLMAFVNARKALSNRDSLRRDGSLNTGQ